MLPSQVLLLVALALGAAGAEPTGSPRALLPGADAGKHLYGRQIQQLSVNSTEIPPMGAAIVPVALADDEQSYYAVISAGNISFRVALDTGSSDTWLMSSACTSSVCKKVPTYPLAYSSPSFVSINNNETAFAVSYADGTAATGFVAMEAMKVQNLTIPSQAIGVVTSSNVPFGSQISGILGLGFPRLSTITNVVTAATPFLATLAQNGLLSYPLFGVSITRNSGGSLTLGAIDSTVVTNLSKIIWNEVVEFSPFGHERNVSGYLHWAIPLSNIFVGGAPLAPNPTYATQTQNTSIAMLDVGTPGIFGPYQDVVRIFDAIDGSRLVDAGQWAIPCDTLMTMSFTFGGANFTMQPTDYLIGPAQGNPQLCLTWPRALPPKSDGVDWQFGSPFLRTVYTVFSYGINAKEPPMIGLYPLSNATTVQPPAVVSAFFSTASATVATTLPNSLLATPAYTTPAYAFNTSVPASIGAIVTSDLATSTYSPLLRHAQLNTSALPTAAPSPTLATFIITDPSGVIHTSTSTAAVVTVTLGVPYGSAVTNGARASSVSPRTASFLLGFLALLAWVV